MNVWILIVLMAVALFVFVRMLYKQIVRLSALWRWQQRVRAAGLCKQDWGSCRSCQHKRLQKAPADRPKIRRFNWFCMYYWCWLSEDYDESPIPCKACNLGLLKLGAVPNTDVKE